MTLTKNQISTSTVSFNDKNIPIIVYSPAGKVSGVTKNWYTDVDAFNNSKFYYCEERVADDYIVLALYAREVDYPLSPALILQMEDDEFNLKEKWLRDLLILEQKKPDATPLNDADLKLLFPSLTDAEQEILDDRKNYWAYVSTNMKTLFADCKGKDVTLDYYDNKKISASSHTNTGKQMITSFKEGVTEFKYYNKVYINTDFEAGGAKYDIAAHNFGGTKTYNAANRPTIKSLEDLLNAKLVKSVTTPNYVLIAFYETEGSDPFIVYQVNGTDGGIKEAWLNYFNIVENEEKVEDLIETIVDAQDEDYKGIVDLEKKLTNESVFARDFEIEDKKFDVYIERSGKVEDDKSKVYLFTSEEKTKILGFDGEFTSFTLTNNSGGITKLSVPTTQEKDFVAFVLKPELGHAANIRAICERIQQAGVNQKTKVSFEAFNAVDPNTWWTPMPNIKLGETVFDFRSYQVYSREDKEIVLANIKEYTANDPEKYGKAIIFKNKKDEEVVRLNVKKEQYGELKEYLLFSMLDEITVNSTKALSAGEDINPTSYACNITVRAYLYYHKNDSALFPESYQGTSTWGAPLCCPTGANSYAPESIKIGKVNWDGRANNIYDSFEEGDLDEHFTEIVKSSTQTWNDFFNDLQRRANKGEVIIGNIKRSGGVGHIVAIMPESLYTGDDKIKDVGDDKNVKFPTALEGGGDVKEVKPFIASESELTRTTNPYKFYRYIK